MKYVSVNNLLLDRRKTKLHAKIYSKKYRKETVNFFSK